MAVIKLVGGFADGLEGRCPEGDDAIFIPKQFGRQGYKGTVSREQMRDQSDMVRYVRSGRVCPETGLAIFVAEGVDL